MQKVSSAYTKDADPVDFVKSSFVVYVDKKRTTKLLRTIGFKTPIELQQSGYIGSISYKGQNVNIFGENFSEVFKEKDVTSFSLKETSNISAKERNELLDTIEHLKGEFEVTKFAKADPNTV